MNENKEDRIPGTLYMASADGSSLIPFNPPIIPRIPRFEYMLIEIENQRLYGVKDKLNNLTVEGWKVHSMNDFMILLEKLV